MCGVRLEDGVGVAISVQIGSVEAGTTGLGVSAGYGVRVGLKRREVLLHGEVFIV